MPAIGMPAGYEMIVLLAALLTPVFLVIIAIRFTRKERRELPPDEQNDPSSRRAGDR